VIFFIVAGVFLDRELGHSPIFTLGGVAIALIAAGYQLIELANVGRADRKPGPVTRGITHLPLARLGRGKSRSDRGLTENEE
jgi:hypothetical protein